MRTTLTIDDAIMAALKKKAFETDKPLKVVINEALALGLQAQPRTKPRNVKLKTFTMGGPQPGVDLVKANQLAGDLEDEEIARKLELKK